MSTNVHFDLNWEDCDDSHHLWCGSICLAVVQSGRWSNPTPEWYVESSFAPTIIDPEHERWKSLLECLNTVEERTRDALSRLSINLSQHNKEK